GEARTGELRQGPGFAIRAGDEDRAELRVPRPLDHRPGPGHHSPRLHAGEAAEPDQLDVAVLERGDESGVVAGGRVPRLDPEPLRERVGDAPEPLFQERVVLIGDAAEDEDRWRRLGAARSRDDGEDEGAESASDRNRDRGHGHGRSGWGGPSSRAPGHVGRGGSGARRNRSVRARSCKASHLGAPSVVRLPFVPMRARNPPALRGLDPATHASPPDAPASDRDRSVVYASMLMALFLAAPDQTIVATALPRTAE